MADRWTLRTPTGDVQLNATFHAPQYQPGGVDRGAALRRDGRVTFQRSGDGLATPGALRLTGRVWRDDQNIPAMLDELDDIREAVAACIEVVRATSGGSYVYAQLAGGPPPIVTPDGLGGFQVEIELWPGRAEPTYLPPIDVIPDGVWLESLFIQQADGSPVTAWMDASDAQYHVTAVDAGSPVFRLARTATGAPAVTNDGSPARLKGATQWLQGAERFTFFLVAASTHTSFSEPVSNSRTLAPGSTAGGFQFMWPTNAANEYEARFDNGNAVNARFGPHKNDGQFHIFCLTLGEPASLGGQGLRTFVDGELAGGIPNLSSLIHNTQPLCLFGPAADDAIHFRYFNGDIAAFLWFRRELNDAERGSIHNYLSRRYIDAG